MTNILKTSLMLCRSAWLFCGLLFYFTQYSLLQSITCKGSVPKFWTHCHGYELFHIFIPDWYDPIRMLIRSHWGIESMHWSLDATMRHDATKRKKIRAIHNTDTMMRLGLSMISIWTSLRKKKRDRKLGYRGVLNRLKNNFTAIKDFLLLKPTI